MRDAWESRASRKTHGTLSLFFPCDFGVLVSPSTHYVLDIGFENEPLEEETGVRYESKVVLANFVPRDFLAYHYRLIYVTQGF